MLRTLRGSVGNVCCDHLIAAWSTLDERGSCRAVIDRGARVLVLAKDIHQLNAIVIVWADFVDRYPSVVTRLDDVFASEGIWANVHHEEVAQAQAAATGVDVEAFRRFVGVADIVWK